MFYLILLCETYTVPHSLVEAEAIDNISSAETSDLHIKILF